jgi:hypothetical protein
MLGAMTPPLCIRPVTDEEHAALDAGRRRHAAFTGAPRPDSARQRGETDTRAYREDLALGAAHGAPRAPRV